MLHSFCRSPESRWMRHPGRAKAANSSMSLAKTRTVKILRTRTTRFSGRNRGLSSSSSRRNPRWRMERTSMIPNGITVRNTWHPRFRETELPVDFARPGRRSARAGSTPISGVPMKSLSRLPGGKPVSQVLRERALSLSRLPGGKHRNLRSHRAPGSLSRLPGGKRVRVGVDGVRLSLSRLPGGKRYAAGARPPATSLSRLPGGKRTARSGCGDALSLSRLPGGKRHGRSSRV